MKREAGPRLRVELSYGILFPFSVHLDWAGGKKGKRYMFVSRRSFLQAGLAAAALSATRGVAASCASCCSQKPGLAVQLYSVRGIAGKDVPATFKTIHDMGYQGVEFAGYYGKNAKELKKMLDDAGLKACGTHLGLDSLLPKNLQRTIDYALGIGNGYLVVPWRNHKDAKGWMEDAKVLTAAAEVAKKSGLAVGYHNHQHEFRDKIDGKTKFEILFDNCSSDVFMQLDVGHVVSAGEDPVKWLRKYPNKALTLHAKETYPGPGILGQVKEGSKGVNWDALFPVAEKEKGLRWYIVESEADPNTFEKIRGCVNFLKAKGR